MVRPRCPTHLIVVAVPDEQVGAGVDQVEEEGEDEAAPEELAPHLAPLRFELLFRLRDALQVAGLLQDERRLGRRLELALQAPLHLDVVRHVGELSADHVDLEGGHSIALKKALPAQEFSVEATILFTNIHAVCFSRTNFSQLVKLTSFAEPVAFCTSGLRYPNFVHLQDLW